MRRKVLLSLLSVLLVFTSVPLLAYGGEEWTTPQKILLNESKDKKGQGYRWDADKRTLTFNNARIKDRYFHITAKSATIVVNGENIIDQDGADALCCNTDYDVTIKGSGSLKLIGNLMVNGGLKLPVEAPTMTIRGCSVEADAVRGHYRGLLLRIVDGAELKIRHSLYPTACSLSIDNASMSCEDVLLSGSGSVEITHGGRLTAGGLRDFSSLLVDETSSLFVESEEACALESMGANTDMSIQLLGQEIYIRGGKLALFATDQYRTSEGYVKVSLPQGAVSPQGVAYGTKSIADPNRENGITTGNKYIHYTTIYEEGVNDPVYDPEASPLDLYPILGGSSTFIYQSPEVKEAKEKMGKIRLQAYSQAYAKTKKQKRKIKVWWKQLNEEKQQVSGYEIARSRKRDSGYGIMFSSPTERYINTANLTKGTRYYYKVRAYQQVNYTRYYSDWSNVTDKIAK